MCSGRCKACDAILSEDEMCAKDTHGNYIELCYACFKSDYQDTSEEWLPETNHCSETYLE